jgi:hypothetical protein
MEKEFSPEEKLLQLIKGKNSKYNSEQPKEQGDKNLTPEPKTNSGIKQSESSRNMQPVDTPADTAQAESSGNAKTGTGGKGFSKFSHFLHKKKTGIYIDGKNNYVVKSALSIFFVACILLAGYFVFNTYLSKGSQELESIRSLIASFSHDEEPLDGISAEETKQKDAKSAHVTPASSVEDYQKIVERKTIFASPAPRPEQAAVMESPVVRDMLKELRLVGIITEKPSQAIIEDIKNKQTLFLGEGEMIGGIQVKQILIDRVIIVCNGQSVTLSL